MNTINLTLVRALTAMALSVIPQAFSQTISLESAPPVVVKTVPVAGVEDVDPGLTELRVTFSKPMLGGSWSWSTWGQENFPAMTGQPRYLDDGRTCVLPVRLEPGKFYATWLNSEKFGNFKDRDGRPAVPYLLTFKTAATKTAGVLAPIPDAENLPGKLLFHGRYQHRSRGRDIDTPSELWVKEAPDGGLNVLAQLPFMDSSELATGDPENHLTRYRSGREPSGDRPGYGIDLKLANGIVKLTRRGVREDVDGKQLEVPEGTWLDPNSRPDSYCAANILLRAFALKEGESKEFRVYDWDNSGEGFADYTIRVKHAGKEQVEVPAGTFDANHLVLTQVTSADTWFKKRAGHVTDFWVLDNYVIVRVLRHREPYEMMLLDYTFPENLAAAGSSRAAVTPANFSNDSSSSPPPTVLSVSPPDGATDVETSQEIRIRFDRPMNPFYMELAWHSGGFYPDGLPHYEENDNEFIIPVMLTAGQEQEIAFNQDQFSSAVASGFRNADSATTNVFQWSFSTKPLVTQSGAIKPKVVRVSPASEETTSVLTLVEIDFDQPMTPPNRHYPYLDNQQAFPQVPAIISHFEYDPVSYRITFPVVLPPDQDAKLRLAGFLSAEGIASDPIVLHYRIGTERFSSRHLEQIEAAKSDPRLNELLTSMKSARERLNSGVETVQTISMMFSQAAFNWIRANAATFKWQGIDQVYADITGPMMSTKAFVLGSDGKSCWLYSEVEGKKRLDRSPATDVDEKRFILADPFKLSRLSVQEAINDLNLVYEGKAELEGRKCHRVDKWDVQVDERGGPVFAMLTEWWIDAETLLPAQVNNYYTLATYISRFHYDSLNQPIPDEVFQPPVDQDGDFETLFAEKKPGYDRRFIQISDGSNGRMSGRMGLRGSAGTISSGLN